MKRITQVFEKAKQENRGVFMAGVVPGFPDIATSFEIAKTIIEAGADILELSSSFSDPVADGPTLQQAHQDVLGQGITKSDVFELYKKIRNAFPNIPMFVIEYANCVYKPGIDNYYKKLSESGVDALLIPDLSLEEAGEYIQASKNNNIEQVFITAPTTLKERIIKITEASAGFLYLVTITGVTGQRDSFLQETSELIQLTKQNTNLPIIAGFGISTPEHVQQALSAGADGVVSCSSIINLIKQNLNEEDIMIKRLKDYVQKMKDSTLSN